MIIYITTNLINNKQYIGQDSKNNEEYLGSGKLLLKAINKYGRENFKKEVIEYCTDKEHLNEREKYWITFYDAKRNLNFYNLVDGGIGGLNEKAIEASVKARKGKKFEDYMKPHLIPKVKERARNLQIKMGFPFDRMTREYMITGCSKGGSSHKGKGESNQTKRNIKEGLNKSEKFKKSQTDPVRLDKISISIKKLRSDPNHVYNSIEYKQKLSESHKRRYAENPKVIREYFEISIQNTTSKSKALKYYCEHFNKVSQPTFGKWFKIYMNQLNSEKINIY